MKAGIFHTTGTARCWGRLASYRNLGNSVPALRTWPTCWVHVTTKRLLTVGPQLNQNFTENYRSSSCLYWLSNLNPLSNMFSGPSFNPSSCSFTIPRYLRLYSFHLFIHIIDLKVNHEFKISFPLYQVSLKVLISAVSLLFCLTNPCPCLITKFFLWFNKHLVSYVLK